MITEDILYDVHDAYRMTDDSGYFISGGCYDYAYGLGSALEALGIPVKYWEYGSDAEPQVHIAIEAFDHYIDFNEFSRDLNTLSENGDFYADTELTWKPIDRDRISYEDDMTDEFLQLIEAAV